MKNPMATLGLLTTLSLASLWSAQAADVQVVMQTSKGTIELALDSAKAPKTVENFVAYAKAGFYNGTIFHRVIPGFMVQGGGFTPAMEQRPTREAIQNEASNGLKNSRGTIAMARTGNPHSATAQFFINVADNTPLDFTAPEGPGWGYAVFGKVTKGMDVVDAIVGVPTSSAGPHSNVPEAAIEIKSVEVK
ncbi:MAG: peptidylprolyl isomerase [Gammaproteobacteria bacterium]|nr:peptidylprolyl isomerase [Gammaproteobacteria bacterium]